MSKSKNELFCFFSGFAQRDVEIIQYDKDLDIEIVILTCQNHGKHKLLTGNYIQLDGVLFELIETNNFYFKAC
ncbi:MAG: hypothetical protein H0U70_07200 [Tatlockia sp.]|nr:hypothetical protein [Tatlockia sp.]